MATFGPAAAVPATGRPGRGPGRIEDGSGVALGLARFWAIAIFWNLVSAPALVVGLPQALAKGQRLALVALVFPAAGLALLVQAVRATLRARKFGVSVLEVDSLPATLGGSLAGTIEARLVDIPDQGVRLRLSCVSRRVSGSGKNRSARESILWQEEREIHPGQAAPGARGTSIPVAFDLPADGRATDNAGCDNRIFWRLEAGARVPGVDYAAVFEIPVEGSPAAAGVALPGPARGGTLRPVATASLSALPPESKITIGPAETGGTEFLFPARRNPGAATGATLFLLLFSGFFWLFTHLSLTGQGPAARGPILIILVAFGLFCPILFAIVLILWLRATRVVVGSEGITITDTLLGLRFTRTVPRGEVSRITVSVAMQAGGTAYHDLKIVRKDGGEVTAGAEVRDRREAEFLAAEMTRCLS